MFKVTFTQENKDALIADPLKYALSSAFSEDVITVHAYVISDTCVSCSYSIGDDPKKQGTFDFIAKDEYLDAAEFQLTVQLAINEYVDSILNPSVDGNLMAQGPAYLADDEALALDDHGFTSPNLHQRIYPTEAGMPESEYAPRRYDLLVSSTDLYRTVTKYYKNEDDLDDEYADIP